MSQYLKIIEAATPYAKRMTRLRNRIFGDIVRPEDSKSKKVVNLFKDKPIYKEDYIVNYYPNYIATLNLTRKLRAHGLYRDEHQDFVDEMSRLRKLRGKVKPKKGSGKQAMNK